MLRQYYRGWRWSRITGEEDLIAPLKAWPDGKFTSDGKRFDRLKTPLPRSDHSAVQWMLPIRQKEALEGLGRTPEVLRDVYPEYSQIRWIFDAHAKVNSIVDCTIAAGS